MSHYIKISTKYIKQAKCTVCSTLMNLRHFELLDKLQMTKSVLLPFICVCMGVVCAVLHWLYSHDLLHWHSEHSVICRRSQATSRFVASMTSVSFLSVSDFFCYFSQKMCLTCWQKTPWYLHEEWGLGILPLLLPGC